MASRVSLWRNITSPPDRQHSACEQLAETNATNAVHIKYFLEQQRAETRFMDAVEDEQAGLCSPLLHDASGPLSTAPDEALGLLEERGVLGVAKKLKVLEGGSCQSQGNR